MKKVAFILLGFCLVAGATAYAQPPQQRPDGQPFGQGMPLREGFGRPFENMTPAESAEKLTAEMTEVLDLTAKQVKKVTKYNVKDQETLQSLYTSGFGGFGGPMGGGPGGLGGRPGGMPMGGGPGGFGGRPGGMPGGPGGMPGGGPGGQGGPGMMPEGGFPPMTPDLSELEDYWAKKEKKLRKILGDEQFDKWYALHPEQFGIVERPAPFDLPQDENSPILTPQGQSPLN